jgi:hypothetical protein
LKALLDIDENDLERPDWMPGINTKGKNEREKIWTANIMETCQRPCQVQESSTTHYSWFSPKGNSSRCMVMQELSCLLPPWEMFKCLEAKPESHISAEGREISGGASFPRSQRGNLRHRKSLVGFPFSSSPQHTIMH